MSQQEREDQELEDGIYDSDEICPYCHSASQVIIHGPIRNHKCKMCGQFFTLKKKPAPG